jgi:hypothetical protein
MSARNNSEVDDSIQRNKKPSSPHHFKQCPFCKAQVRDDRYWSHIRKSHKQDTVANSTSATTKQKLTPSSHSLKKCPHCPSMVRDDRLEKHIMQKHTKQPKQPTVPPRMEKCPQCSVMVRSDRLEKHIKQKHMTLRKVELITRRIRHQQTEGLCADCGSKRTDVQYLDSNFGPVYICLECEPIVFRRSPLHESNLQDESESGRYDVLNNPRTVGGYETSPRR